MGDRFGGRPVKAQSAAALLIGVLAAIPASAQDDLRAQAGLYAPSAWDLRLGAHAYELPTEDYIDYACGTNGGPPSLPLSGWRDYAKCSPDAETGFHEIYFQYDDENEYWAKAHALPQKIAIFQYTSAYEIPVIVSGLFDGRGFLVGIRMVSDPRVSVEIRERGAILGNFLRSRYGEGWNCEDLPRLDGEAEFQGSYVNTRCRKSVDDPDATVEIVTHNFRKPGQVLIDPVTRRPTTGQFESSTRFELVLRNAAVGQPREAPTEFPGPTDRDLLAAWAMDCPGCDLRGVNLKRADLRGANLAGADLSGANLHAAILAGANLANANLEGANLNRADLKRANLEGANIQEAMMYEARCDGANLIGADLTLTNAGRVQFIGANLTGARMVAMDLRAARMNDAVFLDADLSGSLMDDAQLSRSKMAGVIILEATMPRVQLIDADLTGADLRASNFINANLRGANLTSANLSLANLYLANLSDVTKDGAIWNDAVLPGGFAP
ncbi:MAG: pentapeptide repeat-containing protein [Proteobacteria bacterium]|nr:pentapeptide repeat-containing protein [Pseudomonadota bacterium]